MKNVLQFIGSFHQGGSERQAVQLTRLLHEDKTHKVFIAALTNEGVLKSEIENLGFKNIPEFKLTSFFDLNFARQLKNCARFLKENNIDVVHTHDFYTNVFGILAAKLAGTPLKIASKRETGGMRSAAQIFIENQVFKIADSIVVNSEAVKNYLKAEGINENKARTIYNGLDLQRLAPQTTNRREICEKLSLPAEEDIKFITMVANLRHPVKNQPMFLRAAQKVVLKYPQAHFVLAGEGELYAELKILAKDLNIAQHTHFTGLCKNVPELLHISYACALTSFSEGFSNSILEYMAASKPVVATRVGGANEAVVEGETGFLIESDDDKALAERLLALLQNETHSEEMGVKARNFVEQRFSLDSQLNQTLKLYEGKL